MKTFLIGNVILWSAVGTIVFVVSIIPPHLAEAMIPYAFGGMIFSGLAPLGWMLGRAIMNDW
jgi:hypothetical protein